MPDVTSDAGTVLAQPNQNQSEADPGGIANATSAPNAIAPPAPDISEVPRSTKFNVIKTPGQAAAEQAAAADNAHHNLFGRAVKATFHALNNTQPLYQANPKTGRIEETSVPAKPGQFFRNLLSGMLIGAAAGSERATDKEGRFCRRVW